MAFRINVVSNYLGQIWSVFLGLVFVPLFVKYLGVEAYGLIGIYSLLQACLSLLDAGMTPTLGREMALYTGGAIKLKDLGNLLRSIEVFFIIISVTIVSGVSLFSNWLATDWLRIEKLSVETVSQSFVIMGLVVALRFFEGIYRSCIVGLQRQVLFNVISSLAVTIRWVGAVCVVLWVSKSIQVFFLWQAISSILSIMIFGITTYKILPPFSKEARFSIKAIKDIWKFARGMLGITALTILLVQVDKLILSKLLLLSEYSYYILASTLAGGLTMLVSPIAQAFYPRATELYARREEEKLSSFYHLGAQTVTVFMGSVAIVFVFFSYTILLFWTRDKVLSVNTAMLVSILSIGNLLNGLMWIPYQTQLAYGWTKLSVILNLMAILFIVPAILWIAPRYGSKGAACVWVALNIGYVFVGIHFMYARILKKEKIKWYLNDISKPLLAILLIVGFSKIIKPDFSNIYYDVLWILLSGLLAVLAGLLSASSFRELIIGHVRKLRA